MYTLFSIPFFLHVFVSLTLVFFFVHGCVAVVIEVRLEAITGWTGRCDCGRLEGRLIEVRKMFYWSLIDIENE